MTSGEGVHIYDGNDGGGPHSKEATDKSLILLDEIGRGTSTFDGLSIAWSVTEDICNRIHGERCLQRTITNSSD